MENTNEHVTAFLERHGAKRQQDLLPLSQLPLLHRLHRQSPRRSNS
jgi:hypothetical protein